MRIAICAAAALLISVSAAPSASAQDYVVIGSSSAALSPGLMLKAESEITLAPGEAITLFGPGGELTIDGPYEGAVARPASGGEDRALAALIKRRDRIRKIGAARGDETAAESVAIFNILTDKAYCVDDAGPPTLFAPPSDQPRVISLRSGAAFAEIFWPAEATTRSWPDDAPFAVGETYRVSIGDVELPEAVVLRPAPAGGDAPTKIAAFLNAGCFAQAEAELSGAAARDK